MEDLNVLRGAPFYYFHCPQEKGLNIQLPGMAVVVLPNYWWKKAVDGGIMSLVTSSHRWEVEETSWLGIPASMHWHEGGWVCVCV